MAPGVVALENEITAPSDSDAENIRRGLHHAPLECST
jgi:hypothetical protein